MEAKLHIELQGIEAEIKGLQNDIDNLDNPFDDVIDTIELQIYHLIRDGIRVAKELQNLMAKRDNCNAQKHLMLTKYPSKYKSLEDLDYLNEYYL
jgi:hypothetical protein